MLTQGTYTSIGIFLPGHIPPRFVGGIYPGRNIPREGYIP